MKNPSSPKTCFGTLAVHAGQEPEPTTGAIIPPIFQTSTYVQPDVAEPKQGYDYARVQVRSALTPPAELPVLPLEAALRRDEVDSGRPRGYAARSSTYSSWDADSRTRSRKWKTKN